MGLAGRLLSKKSPLDPPSPWSWLGAYVAIDAERPYVHRVIRIEKDRIITQGDNNPHPDEQPLTPDRSFQKVTGAVAFDGSPRRFYSGENGITNFRHHQRRRRFRTALLTVFRNIGRVFSRRFELCDRLDFKGSVCYGRFGLIVARRSPAGTFRFRKPFYRLFFRLPKEEE